VGAPITSGPDAGYHPIASWMVAVNFTDELTLSDLEPDQPTTLSRVFAPEAPVPSPIDWPAEKDLAFRAHALLEQHVGRRLPVAITVTKRIPVGAGLGGGSGNAAGVLVGLDDFFRLNLPEQTLVDLGAKLGADVAFLVDAMRGRPSAVATGRGEKLAPAPARDLIPIVLIFPPFGCPTRDVYRAFDEAVAKLPAPPGVDMPRVQAMLTQSPLPQSAPFNDLAEPACIVRPQLAELRTQLTDVLKIPVHITGSGSTMFVIAPTASTAKALARKITSKSGLPAIATRTLGARTPRERHPVSPG
jgi:4-diphosphocytidyl-2-C-methyl-D-erythritol kinase